MFKKISLTKLRLSRILLVGLLANAVMTPAVYASSDGSISRSTAYAISALIILALGLAIYLGFVIVHPERF